MKQGLMNQDLVVLASRLGRRAGRAAAELCFHLEGQIKGKAGRGWKGGIHATALHHLAKGDSGRDQVKDLYSKSGLRLE